MNNEVVSREIAEVVDAIEMSIKRQVDPVTQERVKKVSVKRIMQIIERELNEFTKNFKRK